VRGGLAPVVPFDPFDLSLDVGDAAKGEHSIRLALSVGRERRGPRRVRSASRCRRGRGALVGRGPTVTIPVDLVPMRSLIGAMSVVAYLRVSTEEQASEGVSLDAQRDRIEAYFRLLAPRSFQNSLPTSSKAAAVGDFRPAATPSRMDRASAQGTRIRPESAVRALQLLANARQRFDEGSDLVGLNLRRIHTRFNDRVGPGRTSGPSVPGSGKRSSSATRPW
jgi:hypothetical protein